MLMLALAVAGDRARAPASRPSRRGVDRHRRRREADRRPVPSVHARRRRRAACRAAAGATCWSAPVSPAPQWSRWRFARVRRRAAAPVRIDLSRARARATGTASPDSSRHGWDSGRSGHVTGIVLAILFAVVFCRLLLHVWRGELDWIDGAGWMVVALLITASSLLPWYVAWLMPFAALAADRRLWRASIVMTGVFLRGPGPRLHPPRPVDAAPLARPARHARRPEIPPPRRRPYHERMSVSPDVNRRRPAQARAAQRRRARLQRGGDDRGVLRARVRRRSKGCRSSWCWSTTAPPTARPRALDRLATHDPRVRVIHLSRNFGHQAALTAGLDHARGDAVVMIDADLQDPPELIREMLDHWRAGCGRRLRRARSSARARRAFKLATARWFYRLFDKLAQVELQPNSGDFRLLDRARARRAAGDARAQPLPARDDRVGRLHADGRPLPARRALRGRDEVHAAQDAALLARRDLVVLAPPLQLATLLGFVVSALAFIAIPVVIVLRIARLLPAGLRLDHDRGPAARRHPADRDRDHRRVRRAHLRRGQAPAAVHRAARVNIADRRDASPPLPPVHRRGRAASANRRRWASAQPGSRRALAGPASRPRVRPARAG